MAIADALYDPEDYGPPTPDRQTTPEPAKTGNANVAHEQNKSLWREFIGKLDDPNVRQAVLATGLNLLRSPSYGQNNGDVAANALQSGVTTLQGLRNMDYQRQQQGQARTDKIQQQNVENTQNSQKINISGAQERAYETQVAQQGTASANLNTRENAQLGETGRHNRAMEGVDATRAQADLTRAQAYKAGTTGKTPQDIQKINMLSAQYQAEGMDETSANARAVMTVDSTGRAKSPGEQARLLYQEKLKNWQNDIGNFGKSLTQEQAQKFLEESLADVSRITQFNAGATGTAPPETARSGPIQRGTPAPTQGESAVGTTKLGYKKSRKGPDSDKTTWTKVNGK